MNIAICDDENNCIERINRMLQKYKETEEMKIYKFLSGEQFLEQISSGNKFDIVFLDIEMATTSGIEVAHILREKNSDAIVIFTTSHVGYVSDTFRLGAFQFLVKPVEEESFCYDFERAISEYKKAHQLYRIRWRDTSYIIKYGDIFYIEAYNRHLYIYTESKAYECVGMLPEQVTKLKPYDFVRCHQGFIINMSKIKEINKADVVLSNDVVIPIGRKYREGLLKAFNIYLTGKLI